MKTRVVHRTGGEILLCVQLYIQLQLLPVNSHFAAINFLVLIPNAIHVPILLLHFLSNFCFIHDAKSAIKANTLSIG